MVELLKKHILIVVAVLLAYSGWSRAQEPDQGVALMELPDPLPQISEDAIEMRTVGERLPIAFDPFRLAERADARARPGEGQAEDAPREATAATDASAATVITLGSLFQVNGQGIAFFDGRQYRVGEQVVRTETGAAELAWIRGPRVGVRYLGEVYELDLYDRPALMLLRQGARAIAAAPEESTAAPGAQQPEG